MCAKLTGDALTAYNYAHAWSRRHLTKKGQCGFCEKEGKTEWSNKDHKYIMKPELWQELCRKCHYEYDVKYLNRRTYEEVGRENGSINGRNNAGKIYKKSKKEIIKII
jgi:hypothetical protein